MSKVNKMLLNAVLITSALVSGQALAQSDGLAGSWTLTMNTPMGAQNPVMAVTAENGEYAGNINGFMGDVELQDIEVNENDFKFGMEMGPVNNSV